MPIRIHIMMGHLFVCTIFMLTVFQSGESIKCYECDTAHDGDLCGTNFEEDRVKSTQCDANTLSPGERQTFHNSLSKLNFTCLAYGFIDAEGNTEIVRKCLLAPFDDMCSQLKTVYDAANVKTDFCKSCNEDHCNFAISVTSSNSAISKNSINLILVITSYFINFIYY